MRHLQTQMGQDQLPDGWHTYTTAASRVRRSRRTIRHWKHQGLPTQLDNTGRRIIREDHLLAWWRDRMTNDPIHQQKLRKLFSEKI